MLNYVQKIHQFKDKLNTIGVFGCFCKTTDSSIIEALGLAGLDYAIVDMEHGPATTETLKHHLMAAQASGMLGIVRVPSHDSPLLEKALDIGAHGIQVSSINNAEQARNAVKRMRFYPSGERGVCRFVRAASYAERDKETYFSEANNSLVILQLEGTEAISNLGDIMQVGGVDILFIGPYDLSQSLGVPGQIEHERVVNAMQDIVKQAKKHNIATGVFCDEPGQAIHWKKLGVKYISYSVEIKLLTQALKELKASLS